MEKNLGHWIIMHSLIHWFCIVLQNNINYILCPFFCTFSDTNLIKFHTQYFWSFNWYLVSAWMTSYCFLHFAKSHNNPEPLTWKKVLPRFISSRPAIVLFKPLWPSWFIIHLIKWIHFYGGAKSLCLENQWPFLS